MRQIKWWTSNGQVHGIWIRKTKGEHVKCFYLIYQKTKKKKKKCFYLFILFYFDNINMWDWRKWKRNIVGASIQRIQTQFWLGVMQPFLDCRYANFLFFFSHAFFNVVCDQGISFLFIFLDYIKNERYLLIFL